MRVPKEFPEMVTLGTGVVLLGLSHLFHPVAAILAAFAGGGLCAQAIAMARRAGRGEALEELTAKVFLLSASVQSADTPEHPAKDEEVAN